MAQKPLAVLDTTVVFYALADPDNPRDEQERMQCLAVTEKLTELQKTHRFGLPTVVVAELGRDGDAQETVEAIVSAIPGLTTLALGYEGGKHASKLRLAALLSRRGRERGAVTYDALIFATALEHGASCIVTENGDDFRALLEESPRPISIVVPSDPVDSRGQVLLFSAKTKVEER